MFCHEDTACIIQSPSEWPFSSVAQIKLHMNQVIFEPEIRLRRTNHYKVKYLLSRETLRNSKHHVEKLYKASRLLAFIYRRRPVAAVIGYWLLRGCICVQSAKRTTWWTCATLTNSYRPWRTKHKKGTDALGGGVLTLPLKPPTVSWRHNINFHLSSS